MKIFISWSGRRSREVALSLEKCLRFIFGDEIEIFMSRHAIKLGVRALDVLHTELKKSSCGILCLTPENVTSSWILFDPSSTV